MCITADSAELLTGHTTKGDQRTITLRHPPRVPHVIHDTEEVRGAAEGECNLIPASL